MPTAWTASKGNRFIDDKIGELHPVVTTPRRVMARRNKYRQ